MFYPRREKRAHPRHSFKESGATVPFSTIKGTKKNGKPVQAQVLDISQGGACLRGDHRLKDDDVVRCDLSLPGIPVSLPTLMRVRWTRKLQEGYMIGMQFLI